MVVHAKRIECRERERKRDKINESRGSSVKKFNNLQEKDYIILQVAPKTGPCFEFSTLLPLSVALKSANSELWSDERFVDPFSFGPL